MAPARWPRLQTGLQGPAPGQEEPGHEPLQPRRPSPETKVGDTRCQRLADGLPRRHTQVRERHLVLQDPIAEPASSARLTEQSPHAIIARQHLAPQTANALCPNGRNQVLEQQPANTLTLGAVDDAHRKLADIQAGSEPDAACGTKQLGLHACRVQLNEPQGDVIAPIGRSQKIKIRFGQGLLDAEEAQPSRLGRQLLETGSNETKVLPPD